MTVMIDMKLLTGRNIIFCFVVFLCAAVFPAKGWAQDMIRGKYLTSFGSTIVLELYVQEPPPSNIIVHQFLPKGISLVRSEPVVTRFSPKKGKAKWLLKKVGAGTMRITMELSAAIEPGAVMAKVRCRDQETGKMTDIVIK
jgi:hypothetical protein